jgi:hypothetical protein
VAEAGMLRTGVDADGVGFCPSELDPYQLNAGNRCADRRFRRPRPTVRAKGMR